MKLLIVESPSKAKTISQYLGKEFTVISSYGHIRGLPSSRGSVKPEDNFNMVYEIAERSKKHVNEIIKHAKKAETIYLATDPDREGEAISWHITEILREAKACKKAVTLERVVFNEITKKAIQEAVAKPRTLDHHLIAAQQARQALDYLYGFTLSPVLWRKLPGSKSAGRVQSVALRVISDREKEIEAFKVEEYWSITADFLATSLFTATLNIWQGQKWEKFSARTEQEAIAIKEHLAQGKYKVVGKEQKQVKRAAHPPFTTSTMLQEAAKKLGFSAKKTSKIAQDLYEGIEIEGKLQGLITYMRTDSVSISQDAIMMIREHIDNNFGAKYLPDAARQYKTKSKNAQEAHEAIRPTNVNITPNYSSKFLSKDHQRLYEMIWKRTVASQMAAALLDQVSVDIADEPQTAVLRANGSIMVFDGFYRIYNVLADKSENILPPLEIGQSVNLQEVFTNQHFTQPPPRYTEASLVKKMEELGIGRPSTYPAIISIIQERGYVKLEKKRFFSEMKGRFVSVFLANFFNQYVDYNFTAHLENELDELAAGKISMLQVLNEFWQDFKSKTDDAMQLKIETINQAIEEELGAVIYQNVAADRVCKECHTGTISLKLGKFGPFLACSNYPTCNFTQPLITDAKGEERVEEEQVTDALKVPKILGDDTEGAVISLRKGPYGFYVQRELGKDVKRSSIPKGKDINFVDLTYAVSLLSLPRAVGPHPDGGVINAGFGKFGPYIEYNKKYTSIKNHDPLTISLSEAISILASKVK